MSLKSRIILHTLFKVVQVPELYKVVAVVIVGDVDFGVLGGGILHPRALVPAITVLFHRQLN